MPIDSDEVARTARKALEKAQKRHEEWSGWWWAPPEYVATVQVAGAVHQCAKVAWVTPEYGITDTLACAGRSTGSKPDLPPQGRFDIVVWTKKRPRGVIEIKTRGISKLPGDVERVCEAIAASKRIDWGLVAFICARYNGDAKSGRDWVRDETSHFAENAKRTVKEHGLASVRHRGKMHKEEDGAWVAEVLEIRR